MNTIELRQNRAALVKKAREVLEAPGKEKREETQEDRDKYDRIMADIDSLGNKIKTHERQETLEAEMRAPTETAEPPEPEGQRGEDEARAATDEQYAEQFRAYLRTGTMGPMVEQRALQMDSESAGGYAVMPQKFISDLIQARDDMVFVRKMATKYQVPDAASLGAPSLDNDPADPTWVSEITTGSADSTMSFGKRELRPHPLAQSLRVSNKLLRAAAINIEQLVRARLGYKISVVEENAFLNGSGADEPLGVFTASANGISTGQDVSTGNASTAILPDGLYEAKYALEKQYRTGCVWIFHRDGVKMIMKLKDGEGRYLLTADNRSGPELDRLLGFPVYESEYAPNTFTTTLYVGILGNFSYYWIADALNATIQVVRELYAATNQTGFFSRTETDGMPVHEKAFVRVKLA